MMNDFSSIYEAWVENNASQVLETSRINFQNTNFDKIKIKMLSPIFWVQPMCFFCNKKMTLKDLSWSIIGNFLSSWKVFCKF